jgi:hypothetical protein
LHPLGYVLAHSQPGWHLYLQPWCIWPAIGGKVSGLDQLHRQPRFLAGGGKALIHGGE